MMLRAVKMLGKENFKDEVMNALNQTVDDILDDDLHEINNNTTAIIPMLLTAYDNFNKD